MTEKTCDYKNGFNSCVELVLASLKKAMNRQYQSSDSIQTAMLDVRNEIVKDIYKD